MLLHVGQDLNDAIFGAVKVVAAVKKVVEDDFVSQARSVFHVKVQGHSTS